MSIWRVIKSKGKGKCYNYIRISIAERSNLKRKWSTNIFHVNLLNCCKEHSCLCNYQINGIQSNFGSKIPYYFRACANEKKKKTWQQLNPSCMLPFEAVRYSLFSSVLTNDLFPTSVWKSSSSLSHHITPSFWGYCYCFIKKYVDIVPYYLAMLTVYF